MRKFLTTITILVIATMALASGALATDHGNRRGDHGDCKRGRGLDAIGLTADQQIICFLTGGPERAKAIGVVTGLTGDVSLVGIDFRPADSKLYGVGNAGGIYTIDPASAVTTKVSQLTVALAGASFGVDVNPAADALRIISDTGQNLRYSFATGATFTDGGLVYDAVTATGVVGAAYTNNDLDPNTATTLFDIDSMLDQVAIQSPANSGQLVPTGKLGVDTGAAVGFDIYSTIRNGTTKELSGFAALTANGASSLYGIDLLTGRASLKGNFPFSVVDIAVFLNQS